MSLQEQMGSQWGVLLTIREHHYDALYRLVRTNHLNPFKLSLTGGCVERNKAVFLCIAIACNSGRILLHDFLNFTVGTNGWICLLSQT